VSEQWAKIFAMALLVMCIVPMALHLMDIIRTMRHINQICDWTPRFRDNESTDSEGKKSDSLSEDLRPPLDDNSIVEKTITLTDNSIEEVNEGAGAQKTPPLTFIEEPMIPEPEKPKPGATAAGKAAPAGPTPVAAAALPAGQPTPAQAAPATPSQPQGGPPKPTQAPPQGSTQAATSQAPQPTPQPNFDPLNFSNALGNAA